MILPTPALFRVPTPGAHKAVLGEKDLPPDQGTNLRLKSL